VRPGWRSYGGAGQKGPRQIHGDQSRYQVFSKFKGHFEIVTSTSNQRARLKLQGRILEKIAGAFNPLRSLAHDK
jgi:hypothetical protein